LHLAPLSTHKVQETSWISWLSWISWISSLTHLVALPTHPSAVGMTVVRRRSSDVASCGASLSLPARATNVLNWCWLGCNRLVIATLLCAQWHVSGTSGSVRQAADSHWSVPPLFMAGRAAQPSCCLTCISMIPCCSGGNASLMRWTSCCLMVPWNALRLILQSSGARTNR